MKATARIGLLLLGLLALAGAVHAPLHADGVSCSPLALCSGAMALGTGLLLAVWTLVLTLERAPAVLLRVTPRDLRPRLTVRGRAPPRG